MIRVHAAVVRNISSAADVRLYKIEADNKNVETIMVSAFFCKIVHCLTLFLFLWKFRIRFVLFHAAPALCKFADSDELIPASGKLRNDCLGGSGGRFIQIVHQYDISILYMVQYGFLGTCGIPRFPI